GTARAERRLGRRAGVGGETCWEGSHSRTAEGGGVALAPARAPPEKKTLRAPPAGTRLAGEREYAFKHVLIRDVAYGMLPKAIRCRKHVEVAEFIGDRAGERRDAFIGLIAEHYARAAALGAEAGLDAPALGQLHA